MGSFQIEIKYLMSPARILFFPLQTDLNQLFQMRYYKTFKDKLKQSYRLSNFAVKKNSRPFGFEATFLQVVYSESLLSARPGFESRTLQTLRLCSFAAPCSTRSYTTSFESPITPLLEFKSLWVLAAF